MQPFLREVYYSSLCVVCERRRGFDILYTACGNELFASGHLPISTGLDLGRDLTAPARRAHGRDLNYTFDAFSVVLTDARERNASFEFDPEKIYI